jgi:hypothetical protein
MITGGSIPTINKMPVGITKAISLEAGVDAQSIRAACSVKIAGVGAAS